MKKRNPITESMLRKFVNNVFDNIKNNNRAKNIKALKTDPEFQKAEEKLAKAYDEFMANAKKRKAKYGF